MVGAIGWVLGAVALAALYGAISGRKKAGAPA
jgi:hypothetical protein